MVSQALLSPFRAPITRAASGGLSSVTLPTFPSRSMPHNRGPRALPVRESPDGGATRCEDLVQRLPGVTTGLDLACHGTADGRRGERRPVPAREAEEVLLCRTAFRRRCQADLLGKIGALHADAGSCHIDPGHVRAEGCALSVWAGRAHGGDRGHGRGPYGRLARQAFGPRRQGFAVVPQVVDVPVV